VERKDTFNEMMMMMMSALHSTINMLHWFFIALAHSSNTPYVDMSLYLDTKNHKFL